MSTETQSSATCCGSRLADLVVVERQRQGRVVVEVGGLGLVVAAAPEEVVLVSHRQQVGVAQLRGAAGNLSGPEQEQGQEQGQHDEEEQEEKEEEEQQQQDEQEQRSRAQAEWIAPR